MKIDWDRYVDEDEEEEGFDTSALDGGMGMGGMPPGMEVSSSFVANISLRYANCLCLLCLLQGMMGGMGVSPQPIL